MKSVVKHLILFPVFKIFDPVDCFFPSQAKTFRHIFSVFLFINFFLYIFLILTTFAASDSTSFTMGPKIPDDRPMTLIIEYSVPAKLGARSCEFCKLVNVAAPLKPKERVKMATMTSESLTYGIVSNKSPGIICAEIGIR